MDNDPQGKDHRGIEWFCSVCRTMYAGFYFYYFVFVVNVPAFRMCSGWPQQGPREVPNEDPRDGPTKALGKGPDRAQGKVPNKGPKEEPNSGWANKGPREGPNKFPREGHNKGTRQVVSLCSNGSIYIFDFFMNMNWFQCVCMFFISVHALWQHFITFQLIFMFCFVFQWKTNMFNAFH